MSHPKVSPREPPDGSPPGRATPAEEDGSWKSACRVGGIAALVSLAASLATMVVLVTVGGPPDTVEETFALLRERRVEGLFRLELLSLFNVGAYYFTFFGLYAALRRTSPAYAALSTILVVAGVTLFIASHPMNSMISLADRWALAATEADRLPLLGAGEALMAADMWHSTGALAGGALIEVGAILISLVMLRSPAFARATARIGLVTHGLDLTQILVGTFVAAVKVPIMAVAGPLYLVWFFLVGRDLLRAGATEARG